MFSPRYPASRASAMAFVKIAAAVLILPAQEDVGDGRLNGVGGDDHALDELMGVAFE